LIARFSQSPDQGNLTSSDAAVDICFGKDLTQASSNLARGGADQTKRTGCDGPTELAYGLLFGLGTEEVVSMKRGPQLAINGRSKSKKLKRPKKRIAFASIAQRYTELLSLRRQLSEVESWRATL
jgi:hypothetical protein